MHQQRPAMQMYLQAKMVPSSANLGISLSMAGLNLTTTITDTGARLCAPDAKRLAEYFKNFGDKLDPELRRIKVSFGEERQDGLKFLKSTIQISKFGDGTPASDGLAAYLLLSMAYDSLAGDSTALSELAAIFASKDSARVDQGSLASYHRKEVRAYYRALGTDGASREAMAQALFPRIGKGHIAALESAKEVGHVGDGTNTSSRNLDTGSAARTWDEIEEAMYETSNHGILFKYMNLLQRIDSKFTKLDYELLTSLENSSRATLEQSCLKDIIANLNANSPERARKVIADALSRGLSEAGNAAYAEKLQEPITALLSNSPFATEMLSATELQQFRSRGIESMDHVIIASTAIDLHTIAHAEYEELEALINELNTCVNSICDALPQDDDSASKLKELVRNLEAYKPWQFSLSYGIDPKELSEDSGMRPCRISVHNHITDMHEAGFSAIFSKEVKEVPEKYATARHLLRQGSSAGITSAIPTATTA